MEAATSTRLGLNKAHTNTFFTSSKQMEVAKETLAQLGKEGCKESQAPRRPDEESSQGDQPEPCHGPLNPVPIQGKDTEETSQGFRADE
eukprot:3053177-Ditylum_brightwellii.AAC.1